MLLLRNTMQCTPPEIVKIATKTLQDLVPEKSRKVYEFAYHRFVQWADQRNAVNYSENVLLAYFNHLSEKENLKSSTLWSNYSMLKTELNINHNVQIASYAKLTAFLKRKNTGYKPKQSKTLSKEQVDNFLNNADDEKYLAMKVILILGVSGACRCDEMCNLTIDNIEDLGSAMLIKFPETKTHKSRAFTILGDFYLNIIRKYITLREGINIPRFLVKYQNGKCQKIVIGRHKIASVPQEIASFLKLPNSKEYTGHCMRRTSATLLVDSGGDISALKRHDGWKSTTVAESYIDASIENKKQTAIKILAPSEYNVNSSLSTLDCGAQGSSIIEEGILRANNVTTNITNNTNLLNNEFEVGLNRPLPLFQNCKLENCTITVNMNK